MPCADFSFAQPGIKQQLTLVEEFQRFIKHTAVFYIRITARSKAVCDTRENLNVIRGFDLLQYIFCTTTRFFRESLVGFYNIVIKA